MTVDEWLEGYRTAWVEADADAAAALFTTDAEYRKNPYEEPFRGRAGIHEYWTGITAPQSEVVLRYGRPVSEPGRTAVEWWVTMLVDGAEVTIAGEFLLRFDDDGRCRELREYWNVASGRHEPPSGWGS